MDQKYERDFPTSLKKYDSFFSGEPKDLVEATLTS
jgi:hypothetical protein